MSIIIKVTRGRWIESKHIAYGVVVNGEGQIVYSSEDPDYLTCIRSSLKPFQAAASVRAGAVDSAGFGENELALMCASHFGEDIHVETAKAMINKLGLSSKHYECGVHYPYNKNARIRLYSEKKDAEPWHNNCSGKHAGMLALAKHLNAPLNNYVSPNHPVQTCIMDYVRELTGCKDFPLAIDGCSAPTPFLSLRTLALLFQKLAVSEQPELNTVYSAMTNHPYLIAGEDRFDTDFMRATKGRAVSKGGGEAVQGIGIRMPDGEVYGVAVKVLDGSQRACPVASMAVMCEAGLLLETEIKELEKYHSISLYNLKKLHIGEIKAFVNKKERL